MYSYPRLHAPGQRRQQNHSQMLQTNYCNPWPKPARQKRLTNLIHRCSKHMAKNTHPASGSRTKTTTESFTNASDIIIATPGLSQEDKKRWYILHSPVFQTHGSLGFRHHNKAKGERRHGHWTVGHWGGGQIGQVVFCQFQRDAIQCGESEIETVRHLLIWASNTFPMSLFCWYFCLFNPLTHRQPENYQ